ncbi:hypothetical protein D9M73_100360 [compost metagenome]
MIRIGASAGLTLRKVGGLGRLAGSCPLDALMAACTSSAAASMLRSRSNCKVICVEPMPLVEVICASPAISENCRSSGWARFDAMVSGLAPGRLAETCMVGKSTCGSGATGSSGNTAAPTRSMASASSVVPMGRLMKAAETLTCLPPLPARARSPSPPRPPCCPGSAAARSHRYPA